MNCFRKTVRRHYLQKKGYIVNNCEWEIKNWIWMNLSWASGFVEKNAAW